MRMDPGPRMAATARQSLKDRSPLCYPRLTTPSGTPIKPHNIRIDKLTKGYTGESFADAFERYLSSASPPHQSQSATPLQPNEISNLKEKSSATPDFFVADENGT